MLTLKTLRDDPQHVIDKLAVKNFDAKDIVYKVLELDDHRKVLQTESDSLLAKQKQLAAQIGGLMKPRRRKLRKRWANLKRSRMICSLRPMLIIKNCKSSSCFFRICLATW